METLDSTVRYGDCVLCILPSTVDALYFQWRPRDMKMYMTPLRSLLSFLKQPPFSRFGQVSYFCKFATYKFKAISHLGHLIQFSGGPLSFFGYFTGHKMVYHGESFTLHKGIPEDVRRFVGYDYSSHLKSSTICCQNQSLHRFSEIWSCPLTKEKEVRYHEPEYCKFGENGNKYFCHATGQLYYIKRHNFLYINQSVDCS